MMKVFAKWFGPEKASSEETVSAGSVAGPAPDYAESPRAENYDEDTSFNWRALESSSSAVFDSPDTHRVRILQSAPERPANDDDNPGYDPYDTGRFDSGIDN